MAKVDRVIHKEFLSAAATLTPLLLLALAFQIRFSSFRPPRWLLPDLASARAETKSIASSLEEVESGQRQALEMARAALEQSKERAETVRREAPPTRDYLLRREHHLVKRIEQDRQTIVDGTGDLRRRHAKVSRGIERDQAITLRWDRYTTAWLHSMVWLGLFAELSCLTLLRMDATRIDPDIGAGFEVGIGSVATLLLATMAVGLSINIQRRDIDPEVMRPPRPWEDSGEDPGGAAGRGAP